MTTIALTGYIVRETEAAYAFVPAKQAKVDRVRPLWLPIKKVSRLDVLNKTHPTIQTAHDGRLSGLPVTVEIDAEFAAKVGVS
jgi:hypothetical protein